MPEEQKGPGEAFREGIKAGFGILGAFVEAFEETVEEALKQGPFDPEKVQTAFRDGMRRAEEAMEKAQRHAEEGMEQARRRAEDAMERARDRFDWVPRSEFETLRGDLAELRHRFESHMADPVHHAHPGRKGKAGGEPGPEGGEEGK